MESDINLEKWLTDDEYKHAKIIYHDSPMYKIARLRKEKAELEGKLVIALEISKENGFWDDFESMLIDAILVPPRNMSRFDNIKENLGKGRFVPKDSDAWVVTREDLEAWLKFVKDGGNLTEERKECFRSLVRHCTEMEIQSLDDLEENKKEEDLDDGHGGHTCTWKYDPRHDKYDTECGGAFQLNELSGTKEHYNFCPACGNEFRVITEVDDEN